MMARMAIITELFIIKNLVLMKYLKKQDAQCFKNSSSCMVFEYQFGDTDINMAIAEISGRYPEKGWIVNAACKEIGLVLKGTGTLTTETQHVMLTEGDMVLINAGEKYFWDGAMTLALPAAPAWYLEQHKFIA